MTIRVFLADDHAVVRDGVRMVLEANRDMTVVGNAADGRDAVRQVQKLLPDVVVMDVAMPGLNGIEATQQVRELCPGTQVVILSMYASVEHIYRALQAGARGYVLKESAGKEVVAAVRAVSEGRRYLSQKITDTMVDDLLQQRQAAPASGPLDRLSQREREVLQLVADGHSSAEIAQLLHLSPKTVETYRSRLMQKMGISNVPGLVKFAIQHGLTGPE